ncbi:pyridoxamine 5'-phosphate oxidase family protein [Chthonobacter albigriseus]|uniref:pyridoxamine 5'-phosphate oxidase family protein n=1 Tax=Chthonobacter albigriseus TaxID=1683161 RepID=UPI0015EE9A7B|nr:pyridoxamine 5'-phosphate oxidase family protein [Chthonobacter albigriseus]
MDAKTDAEAKAKIWSMIKEVKVAMMVTHAGADRMHARPMVATSQEFDGALWFFTDKRSHKTDEIEENPRVLLAYSDWDSQTYVAIDGTAEIYEDRAKIDEYWQESMRTWFPEGKDDPNVALLRVEADGAAYWDAPSSAMIHAYGYVKALVTGERPKAGDVGRVTF